jgi:CDP-paratose 2-epimerase
LIDLIGSITGKKPVVNFNDWRPSDQKYYVSDSAKFQKATGWKPLTGTSEGVSALCTWLLDNVVTANRINGQGQGKLKQQSKLEPVDK